MKVCLLHDIPRLNQINNKYSVILSYTQLNGIEILKKKNKTKSCEVNSHLSYKAIKHFIKNNLVKNHKLVRYRF